MPHRREVITVTWDRSVTGPVMWAHPARVRFVAGVPSPATPAVLRLLLACETEALSVDR